MTLASVLSPPLESTIEWRSSPRWLGPPWAGVEVLPRPVSSPGREITALQEGAAAMKIDMPMVLIRRGTSILEIAGQRNGHGTWMLTHCL